MRGLGAFFGAFWTCCLFVEKNRVRSKGGADDATMEEACFFAIVKGLEGFVRASDKSESASLCMMVDREGSGNKIVVCGHMERYFPKQPHRAVAGRIRLIRGRASEGQADLTAIFRY